MAEKLTLWCNAKLSDAADAELVAGTETHRLILSPKRFGNLVLADVDPQLNEAEVAFGQPNPEQLLTAPKLKWVQLSSAGYARFDRADIRASFAQRGVAMTNSSGVYAEPCAEHVLAFMLAQARMIPDSLANQAGARGWPQKDLRLGCHLLTGQCAMILGYGSIARRLIELLMPLHMKLIGIRQTPRGDETIPVYPTSELDRLLPTADHVIDILPGAVGTNKFIDARRFSLMKPGAIFYNIGRGTTIDQFALAEMLKSGHMGAAYLDVTEPEPLPPGHPLWIAPNCHITPHTGGGHADEFERIVRHFLDNLSRFGNGSPLLDRVM